MARSDLVYNRPHETVKHNVGEYVRGEVHTANTDSSWALLKRGIIGTYHNVSKKYLPLNLREIPLTGGPSAKRRRRQRADSVEVPILERMV